jgi:hypothetical protein
MVLFLIEFRAIAFQPGPEDHQPALWRAKTRSRIWRRSTIPTDAATGGDAGASISTFGVDAAPDSRKTHRAKS